MNIHNMNAVIAIMQRAKNVNMQAFQADRLGPIHEENRARLAETEEFLHACGNTACIAGHIAVSPEWKEAGGLINPNGSPSFKDQDTIESLAEWLDIPEEIIGTVIYGDSSRGDEDILEELEGVTHPRFWCGWKSAHAVLVLTYIRDNIDRLIQDYLPEQKGD